VNVGNLVLIVDDDADLRETVQMLLEDAGYAALEARDGRDAIEVLRRTDPLPDVILLDLSMPVVNGREFRAEQLADPRIAAIPVIVLSASGCIAEETPTMHVAATLAKPFSRESLIEVVARRCSP
jgi:CheY-like chemotaxis protein